jgi:hypothetical protein
MAKMYQYYEIDGIPTLHVGGKIEICSQLGLPGVASSTACTIVTYSGKSDHKDFNKYFVEHDAIRSNIVWRGDIGDLRRGGLIEVVEFHMYQHKQDGYFFTDTNHPNIQEMCRRLLTQFSGLTVRIRNVDLLSTKEELQSRVSMGYFGNLNIEQVSAASIFGPDVGESDMWGYLTEHGKLNAMTLDFKYFGEMQSVMVHRLGGIMPYHSFGENATLDIVDEVKRLIEPLSTVNEISLRRRRK